MINKIRQHQRLRPTVATNISNALNFELMSSRDRIYVGKNSSIYTFQKLFLRLILQCNICDWFIMYLQSVPTISNYIILSNSFMTELITS
jgi:hypothetical protein